jgi:hypothetical protein
VQGVAGPAQLMIALLLEPLGPLPRLVELVVGTAETRTDAGRDEEMQGAFFLSCSCTNAPLVRVERFLEISNYVADADRAPVSDPCLCRRVCPPGSCCLAHQDDRSRIRGRDRRSRR